MLRLVSGGLVSRAVYVACKLHIPDLLGERPRDAGELAAACGADTDAVLRVVRVLGSAGVVTEDDGGVFALSGAGELLRHDATHSLWSFAVLAGELLEPTASAALYAARTGRTAFDHIHGASLYETLAGDPEHEAMLAAALAARASVLAPALVAVIDWAHVRHVVDVGGNQGALLSALLTQLPDITAVLFDQPHVVAGAGAVLGAGGVAERVDCAPGDFFASVPPGGDLYLLAQVLCDWSDAQAVRILRRCRDAMGAAARLVIVEPVRPDDGRGHPAHLQNLAAFWASGGGVRSAGEWECVLRSAGLEMRSLTATATDCAVIEASR